ncbi:MAG: hypothetical protein J6583_08980 [Gilliamella sp.]|uniref:hypothetical protein n=1 Tax=Gilliamella sp. TaxID=1891236 RepID=UPI0026008139|nr:hypothetical protein [Gilliamella sp.]MCO6545150.1 hypothetical protein [Gilliamella sp.]MCO6547895.1 hypothetical protein [Gilliamella sp.]
MGVPSLLHDVRDASYPVSERTVSRVLQQWGLRSLRLHSKVARKFKHNIDTDIHHHIAPQYVR